MKILLLARKAAFRLYRIAGRLASAIFWRLMGVSMGRQSFIGISATILRPYNISVDSHTTIGNNCILGSISPNGRIRIGSNCILSPGAQIYAKLQVVIEDDVMVSGYAFVADSTHGYTAGDTPYSKQGWTDPLPITIKKGAWIGQNSIIMPGCNIGESAIVGANSVVTRQVPANCIVAGSPAKIIKRFCLDTRQWIPVHQTSRE